MKPELTEPRTVSSPSTDNKDGYIGIFTFIALVGIVCALFWYKNYSPLLRAQRFNVTFNQIAGLDTNAAVFVNGLNVGEVEKVELDKQNHVVARIRINSDKITIPVGSTFRIFSYNVIGSRYVDIQVPKSDPDGQPLKPLDDTMTIVGHDPARAEVVLSNIAESLSGVDFTHAEKTAERNIEQLSQASKNVSILAQKLQPAAEHVVVMEKDVSETTRRMNRILSNPALTSDLKETAKKAKETADSIKETMAKLDSTLSDPELRGDILQAMNSLNESSQHFESAADDFKNMSGDEKLRSDLKQILTEANQSLDKLNKMFAEPNRNNSAGNTLAKARATVDHIDLAARQINQILDRRHPLLHMMFGRPGHVENSPKGLAATHVNQ